MKKQITTDSVFKYMNKHLITPEFLMLVEKWARYDGKKFDIGDIDITVENMGTFSITSESPKISTAGGKLSISKTEMEKHTDVYDVTKIKNNCVCSDFDVRILIAERDKNLGLDFDICHPSKLFIFAITEDKKKVSDEFPSFEILKQDFESDKYTHYSSLIPRSACSDYRLAPFNHNTDRIFNFTGIENDLSCLEADEVSLKLSAHIKPTQRMTYEQLKKFEDKMFAKMHKGIEKRNASQKLPVNKKNK